MELLENELGNLVSTATGLVNFGSDLTPTDGIGLGIVKLVVEGAPPLNVGWGGNLVCQGLCTFLL